MTLSSFTLPEVVDLNSARAVTDDLLHHIQSSPSTTVQADRLRRAGVPLLQILVAARRQAEALGKSFAVTAGDTSILAKLLSTYGLDPAQCGVVTDLPPPAADHPTQRT